LSEGSPLRHAPGQLPGIILALIPEAHGLQCGLDTVMDLRRILAPPRPESRPNATCRRDVSLGSSAGCWKVVAAWASGEYKVFPAMVTSPLVGVPSGLPRRAAMHRSVDLPHPLLPSRQTISRSAISNETFSKTGVAAP